MSKFTDYFKVVSPRPGTTTMTDSQSIGDQGVYANYTWYQRLIQGSASRITRYREYDLMDNDVEVARALDTIAEEMTGSDPQSEIPLELVIKSEKQEDIASNVTMTLKSALSYWCDLHSWETRLYKIARTTIKYGDCFFLRKADTRRWEWIHPKNIVAAIVDERDLTKVIGWQIKQEIKTPNSPYNSPVGHFGKYSESQVDTYAASEIVWFSLNDDIAESAPFGESVLRPIYRAQKQKELLEDAIIIYRIQRAPERRVFYIDVGKMPPQRVKTYLEAIKNEIRQKKIPSFGGGVEQVDSTYNPHCLALNTMIPLLDGRELSLTEIIAEYEQGKKNWAYSINPTSGEIVPGDISWAGITRKNTNVIRLTFDNGQQLTCTPDHKIPVQSKGFIEAKNIIINVDSLFPFNTRDQGLSNNKNKKYKQVYDTSKQKWVFVHRMVAETMRTAGLEENHIFNSQYIDTDKNIVHHLDFDKNNNNPENLVFMNGRDHVLLHSHSFTTNENIVRGRQRHFERLQNDLQYRQQIGEKHGSTLSKKMKEDPALYDKFVANIRKNPYKIENQSLSFSSKMFDIIIDVIISNPTISLNSLIETINNNKAFMIEYHNNNNTQITQHGNVVFLSKIKTEYFSKRSLRKMLNKNGYKNFKTLRIKLTEQKSAYANHRVVKMEYLTETMDVGTITIDGKELLHDYHTFAISAGIYVKNSMNEDFFFASRPDGRGSKVEVLPGGQGLGELADLEYFQWKVFRGLRIPLSFMREGQDNAVINDGKVGVAYIQELRFALFIKRLQGYLSKILDKEYKRYLHAAGINIDTSIFSIKLPEPENFGIYRQQQLDSDLLNTMNTASGIDFLSARFKLKRYLHLTDEEILHNEHLKREELGLDVNGPKSDIQKIYGGAPEGELGGLGGMGGGMIAGGGLGGIGGLGGEPGGLGVENQTGGLPGTPENAGALPTAV